MMNYTSGILLFAHGASDPEWAIPFFSIREEISRLMPEAKVEIAFLEGSPPDFPTSIASLTSQGCGTIVVAPLLFARGRHLKQDLPRLIADAKEAFPKMKFVLLPALGEISEVLRAIANTLATAIADAVDRQDRIQKPLNGA